MAISLREFGARLRAWLLIRHDVRLPQESGSVPVWRWKSRACWARGKKLQTKLFGWGLTFTGNKGGPVCNLETITHMSAKTHAGRGVVLRP